MTTRTRIAITLAAAVALGATSYGRTWTIGAAGLEHQIWAWGVYAAYALAIVAVAVVNRWWALLPAVVPMAVSAYIYNLTDFTSPWESEAIHPTGAAWVILVLLAIGIQAAFLSLGFLLRRAWLWGRRWYRSKDQGHGAERLGS